MPEPKTDEMVTLLNSAMEEALAAISNRYRFANGDVMSAALHVMVDAGMVSVHNGDQTREQLVDDIIVGVRACVMGWQPSHSTIETLN